MTALERLQPSLTAVSLQLNTGKSHLTYFHDSLTPLTATVRDTLSANNIQLHHDWVAAVGAVVGRDNAAIRAGMQSTLAAAGNYDAFFRRVQLDDMPLDSAIMLLRQCLTPAMNYYLRCIAPACIEDEACRFDAQLMKVTMNKLGLDESERNEKTTISLQRKLRDGGWGLTAAARTSPAAYLGSLAACYDEPSFAPYCGATPLPCSSQLHGWVDDGLKRIRQAAPGDAYQADIEPLLPVAAGSFFSHFANADPSVSTALQHSLNVKATQHTVEAAVERLREQGRHGDRRPIAHHKAITAAGASSWKTVRLDEPRLRLADVEYALAARLNLDLQPFPARIMATLPRYCPLCTHSQTGAPVLLRDDPWHWLTCAPLTRGELTQRHDAVVDAIARTARLVGAQVQTEVQGLDPHSTKRPDLQIVFPGRMLLVDVVVTHSLTSSRVARGQSAVTIKQTEKHKKYAGVASRLGAELLNLSVDTCGGMASHAVKLVEAIGEEGERWSAGTWNSGHVKRMLLGSIAVAVQRGNAMVVLSGYTRSAGARVESERRAGRKSEGETVSTGVEGQTSRGETRK